MKMKVVSTNIARMREVEWRGQKITTGIFKEPLDEPMFLGKTGVNKDYVADQKHHGGSDKACYLYSTDHYPFWKEQFPQANWHWGIFGENLSISGLDEGNILIGDVFQIGEAKVQVSQPRLPCYKLGIRFGDSKVVKAFLNSPFPGVYLRVIEEGFVIAGDEMVLLDSNPDALSVRDVYSLFSSNRKDAKLKAEACELEFLSESIKKDLRKTTKNRE